MAKKKIICIAAAAMAAAVLGAVGLRMTRVSIDGALFPKNAAVYDLTEQSFVVKFCGRF